jgi:hypothetical protein
MLQNNPVLKSKIDQRWDKFWSGGIANPLTAIEQITYLLFMKRLDDLDQKQQADAEFPGDIVMMACQKKYRQSLKNMSIPSLSMPDRR